MENLDISVDVSRWSDEQVLRECVRYGEESRKWRNRFLGLLPEVHRRRLYEKHGCISVFEFAFKVGGVTENQVRTALRLDYELTETPTLHGLFTSGEVSIHKMERIVAVANPENEKFLADQVQLLSKSSLDTLVKDIKASDVQSSPLPTIPETTQVAVQLDPEVAQQLLDLRNKGIDIDEELKRFLQQRKEKIEREKEEITASQPAAQGRNLPKKIRNLLKKEHGTKCSIPKCEKRSARIHHTQRFSLVKSHDPHYLAPLCDGHHQIAHTIDLKVQAKKPY